MKKPASFQTVTSISAGSAVKIVWQSREVPGQSVVVRRDAKLQPEALRAALYGELSKAEVALHTSELKAKDFEYVSTLGYFTPRVLDGAWLGWFDRIGSGTSRTVAWFGNFIFAWG